MRKNKNKVTCGILLHTPDGCLLCHPTGREYGMESFDIPKGVKEENETEWECAVRELNEETSVDFKTLDVAYIENLGRFPYTKEKDIHLFYVETNTRLDVDKLTCTSLIDNSNKPEVDGYKITEDITQWVFKSLKNVLSNPTFMVRLTKCL
jgi:ADP-ribose pyrophosphatase YjhB (NUDIX family)